MLSESKEELEQLIASKRASVPPLKRMYSTSDISEEDRRKKTLLVNNTMNHILMFINDITKTHMHSSCVCTYPPVTLINI